MASVVVVVYHGSQLVVGATVMKYTGTTVQCVLDLVVLPVNLRQLQASPSVTIADNREFKSSIQCSVTDDVSVFTEFGAYKWVKFTFAAPVPGTESASQTPRGPSTQLFGMFEKTKHPVVQLPLPLEYSTEATSRNKVYLIYNHLLGLVKQNTATRPLNAPLDFDNGMTKGLTNLANTIYYVSGRSSAMTQKTGHTFPAMFERGQLDPVEATRLEDYYDSRHQNQKKKARALNQDQLGMYQRSLSFPTRFSCSSLPDTPTPGRLKSLRARRYSRHVSYRG